MAPGDQQILDRIISSRLPRGAYFLIADTDKQPLALGKSMVTASHEFDEAFQNHPDLIKTHLGVLGKNQENENTMVLEFVRVSANVDEVALSRSLVGITELNQGMNRVFIPLDLKDTSIQEMNFSFLSERQQVHEVTIFYHPSPPRRSEVRDEKRARGTTRTSESKTPFMEALALAVTEPDKLDAITETVSEEVFIYVEFKGIDALREALKTTIVSRSETRNVSTADISDVVFNRESEALIEILRRPADAKTNDRGGTFILVLPKTLKDSFLKRFVQVLIESNLEGVKIVGKGSPAAQIALIARKYQKKFSAMKNLEQTPKGDGRLAAGILDKEFRAPIPNLLFPFKIDWAGVDNALAEDYTEEFTLTALALAARFTAGNPNITAQELHEKLREVFSRFKSDFPIEFSGNQFTIQGVLAQKFLEARSKLRVKQAA